MTHVRSAQIRLRNDLLRRTGMGGKVVVTAGVSALPREQLQAALAAVAAFDVFTGDNDPYGEHDCAAVVLGEYRLLWKIDYFDLALQHHSPDPADPAVTCRVMTVMLAEEY